MKKTILLTKLLLVSVFLFACDNVTYSTGDGANKISGNGKMVSKQRNIASFNQIELNGVFNVVLSQNNNESVTIETDENLEPFILTTVLNNVLVVKMSDSISINKAKKINILISFKDIQKISTEGVGNLKCNGKLTFNNLDLDCKGVGATNLNLTANKLTVKSEIVGAIELSGNVNEAIINHKGLGAIDAFNLKTEKMNLSAEGIGAAEVYASQELTIAASGVGEVKYKGNPKTKHIKSEGLGKVVNVDL